MQINKKKNKMCQNHTFMGQFSIEKPRKMLYDISMKYYDAEVRMKKQYEEMLLIVCFLKEDIVRTSADRDPFDDEYQDPNIGTFQG